MAESTQYAVWFDAVEPSDPVADIRFESSTYAQAKHYFDEHTKREPDDPPKGICSRRVVHIEHPWEVESE